MDALPPALAERLRTQAFETAALRMRIEEEAAAVLGLFAEAGVPVILIKGVARGALAARFPHLDGRAMQDVDLLLPSDRIKEAYALLEARGYVTTRLREEDEPSHHHLPALWNERRVAVELHESNSGRVPAEMAWGRAEAGAETVEWAGLSVRVPNPTEIAWSAISHGLADGIRGVRLERLLEVAALAGDGARIDWAVIQERSRTREACDSATPAGREETFVLGWVGAALALVDPSRVPADLPTPEFDLRRLLGWRLAILRSRRRWRRAFSARLLEEGPRVLLELPPREAPAGTSWAGRIRRRVASRASRLLFRAWRAARGRQP